jgi:hypothetical protein
MPTLERMFPEKAKRRDEIVFEISNYKKKADEVKQSMVDKFDKELNALAVKYKISIKGTDPDFKIKKGKETDKSKMSDEELDKMAAEGRSNFKKLPFKKKQDFIKKKKKENVGISSKEKEEQEEQQNFIRKGYSNSEALKKAKEKILSNNKGMAAAIKARSL